LSKSNERLALGRLLLFDIGDTDVGYLLPNASRVWLFRSEYLDEKLEVKLIKQKLN